MAKALIKAAYGKGPDRSYIGGTSNGGRHTMVAAARYAQDYDGFLAVSPGFNLPKAAVAQLYGAQQWNTVATTTGTAPNFDLESALPQTERSLIAKAILAKCDALDGLADGLVQDVSACRAAFDLSRDVPTCSGARDGSCLSTAQKLAIGNVFAGARNSKGEALYSRWPYDAGIVQTERLGVAETTRDTGHHSRFVPRSSFSPPRHAALAPMAIAAASRFIGLSHRSHGPGCARLRIG